MIKTLPDVHFHILAHTTFASQVVDLQRYLNVTIYPGFNRYNFESVLSKVDFYLDINHGGVVETIVEEIGNKHKPIFAFDNTSHELRGDSRIFSSTEPEKMVEAIRKFLGEAQSGK